MAEQLKQDNFEEALFKEPDESDKKVKPIVEQEFLKCSYCQDVGTCSYCNRGREVASKMPKPSFSFRKIRKKSTNS